MLSCAKAFFFFLANSSCFGASDGNVIDPPQCPLHRSGINRGTSPLEGAARRINHTISFP